MVVCEQGEELSEVIAPNYAYALGADLVLIPERSRDEAAQFHGVPDHFEIDSLAHDLKNFRSGMDTHIGYDE